MLDMSHLNTVREIKNLHPLKQVSNGCLHSYHLTSHESEVPIVEVYDVSIWVSCDKVSRARLIIPVNYLKSFTRLKVPEMFLRLVPRIIHLALKTMPYAYNYVSSSVFWVI